MVGCGQGGSLKDRALKADTWLNSVMSRKSNAPQSSQPTVRSHIATSSPPPTLKRLVTVSITLPKPLFFHFAYSPFQS